MGKTLKIITNGSEQYNDAAQILQGSLEQIGVKSTITPLDQATYFAALMSSLFSEETLAKGAEKGIRKASGAYGYRLLGFGECRVGGKTGTSFRYTYQAQGIDMAAECCVVKVNGTFFYLYVYYREERKEESCRIWKEILERVRWAA